MTDEDSVCELKLEGGGMGYVCVGHAMLDHAVRLHLSKISKTIT